MLRPAIEFANDGTGTAPRSGLLPPVVVVPRALCEFRRYRRRAPGRAGLSAVALKARAELLAGRSDHVLHIVADRAGAKAGDGVGVWVLPAVRGEGARYLPETLARTPLGERNGVALVHMQPGVEGQVWEAGALVASRWWRQLPTRTDWQLFMRGAKRDESLVGTPLPLARSFPIRADIPALDLSRERLARLFAPARLLAAVGLAALGGLAYYGSQLTWIGAGNARLAGQIDTLTPPAQEVLSLRRRATGKLDRAARSAARQDADVLLRALVGVDAVIGRAHAERPVATDPDTGEPVPVTPPELDSLSFEGGELVLTVGDAPPVAIPALVADIEALPTLEAVTARTLGRDSLEIRATLQTASAPAPGTSTAGTPT